MPRFYFAGLLSVLGGLLLWEVVSRFLVANTLFLAAPSQILTAIVALARSGELWRHMSVSAIEFALGYVIASVLGVIIGFAMAEESDRQARIAAVGLRPLRHADDRAGAAVHSVARHRHLVEGRSWSYSWWSSRSSSIPRPALRTTSERLIEMLRSFGATPRQIFFKVSLPSAVPFILAGLKLGIGRGLIGVVVAELFGSRAGLGRLIAQSADAFNMPELFAGVVVLAVAGIVLTAGFGWLENRLVPWTKD